MEPAATSMPDAEARRRLASRMVNTLPAFGEWATAVRDFETPYGRLGYRQAVILYAMRHGLISEGTVSPSLLAEHYGVQPSVITRVLVRLESSGFISRQTDPSDGRAQTIQITELGTTISVYIEELYVGDMLDSMTFVDADQIDELDRTLDTLTRIVSDLQAKRRRNRSAPVASLDPVPALDEACDRAGPAGDAADDLVRR